MNNILGTSPDTLVNGPAWSALTASIPNRFVRLQARWDLMQPAKGGPINWNAGVYATDAIVANCVAQGRTILYDLFYWPAWVSADIKNLPTYMAQYAAAVCAHWPAISILGVGNEPNPCIDAASNLPLIYLNPSPVNWEPLAVVYDACVRAVRAAVPVTVLLNGGKYQEFDGRGFQESLTWLKALGTWQYLDYITWHAICDHEIATVTQAAPYQQFYWLSAADKIAFAQQLFPGKQVGSDEWYASSTTANVITAAKAYLKGGMLCNMLLTQPCPASGPVQGFTAGAWGATFASQLTEPSKALVSLLTT